MYSIEQFSSDNITSEQYQKLQNFVDQECANSLHPARSNMLDQPPAGMLYLIKNQLRWQQDHGAIFLVHHNDDVIAVSAVEYPEMSTDWVIGGIRTWIKTQHRSTALAGYFLPAQYAWAQQRDAEFMLLTFNHYNKKAWNAVAGPPRYRRQAGWSAWWDDCLAAPEVVTVRHTEQWCVIKPISQLDNQLNLAKLQSWAKTVNK